MPMTAEIMRTFFMIYCPSNVGTRNVCQEESGNTKRGIMVVIRCIAMSTTDRRVKRGNKNKMPINTSNQPKNNIKVAKVINGIVCCRSASTSGFAGL